jgi:DNA repair exonuclease SbcCD ATPase subunit
LQKISDDLSISYATVLKMKDNLDMEKRELQVNNARLAAEVSVVQLRKEQAEKALRDQITQIEAQKLAMAAEHKKAQEEFERILEAEKKKFDILQKEHLSATKNLESKISKLEKNKDLLQINKEMIANLQSEKKALLEQLDAERETTKRLHSYVESTTEDAARFEDQLEAQAQLVQKLQRDIDHKNRKFVFDTLPLNTFVEN